MISYEVTLDIDPRFAKGVETYMRQQHIPEIFSTGCFQQIHFERASSTRFRSRYQALTQAHLDRYLEDQRRTFVMTSAPISRTVSWPFAKYGASCKVGQFCDLGATTKRRHLWPTGIHVGLVIIDGVVDLPRTDGRMPDKPDAFFVKPDGNGNDFRPGAHNRGAGLSALARNA